MYDLKKIEQLSREIYHISIVFKIIADYDFEKSCTEESERMYYLASIISKKSDDLFFEFVREEV